MLDQRKAMTSAADLFAKLESDGLRRRLDDLFEVNSAKSDPILGLKPKLARIYDSFPKKHGVIVEHSITKLVSYTAEWQAYNQVRMKTKFGFQGVGDRLLLNHQMKVAIFLECKRVVDNLDTNSCRSINDTCSNVRANSKNMKKRLFGEGGAGAVFYGVFDAYGTGRLRGIAGVPILSPDDLSILFPREVLGALNMVHQKVIALAAEHEFEVGGGSAWIDFERVDVRLNQEESGYRAALENLFSERAKHSAD